MVLQRLHRLWSALTQQAGQGLAEYALILALIAIVAILAETEAGGRRPEAWVGGTLLLTNTFLWSCHGAEGPVVEVLQDGD